MSTVDQQKIRRTRTGLIAHDPARTQPGYTLFAPMFGDGTVHLVDMDGKSAHTWRLPYRPGLYGYLLDNGHLFYGGKVMEDLARFEAWPRFKGGAVLEVDWRGRVLWEVRHPDHHHDARRLRNGTVLLLCLAPLPADLARNVRGGLPGTEADGVIYADYLVEKTTGGQVVWEWRSWERSGGASHHAPGYPRRVDARQHRRGPHFFHEPGAPGVPCATARGDRLSAARLAPASTMLKGMAMDLGLAGPAR